MDRRMAFLVPLAVAAASCAVCASSARAVEFFALSQPELAIYRIDSEALGKPVLVGNLPGESDPTDLIDAGDRLFAVGSAGRDTNSKKLYRVDLKTGKLTSIGPTGFQDTDTLTYGGDTYFYGANARAEVPNELQRISPRDGKGVTLGNAGVPGFNGIVLCPEHANSKRSTK